MDVNRAATAHLGQWAALQQLPLRRSRVSREETSLSPHTSGLGLPEGAVSPGPPLRVGSRGRGRAVVVLGNNTSRRGCRRNPGNLGGGSDARSCGASLRAAVPLASAPAASLCRADVSLLSALVLPGRF